MPGKQYTGSGKTYLYIIGGNICQKVDEETPGARKRNFENPTTKVKGSKWEIVYRSWEGIIKSLSFRDTDFGHQLNIEFDDAVLTLDTTSRYFSEFAKKLPSIEIEEPVEIAPYDFEPEPNDRKIGINLIQNGKKAKNYYWDETEEKPCHGIPVPIGNTKTYKSDDWQVFYIGVKKFFIAEIEKMNMSKAHKTEEQEMAEEEEYHAPKASKVDEEIPVINPKEKPTTKKIEAEEDEIKIEDVPF